MVKNIKISILLLIVSLNPYLVHFVSAAVIVLKSGQRQEGKLLSETQEYIKLEQFGVPLIYFREDIVSVERDSVSLQPKQAVKKNQVNNCS